MYFGSTTILFDFRNNKSFILRPLFIDSDRKRTSSEEMVTQSFCCPRSEDRIQIVVIVVFMHEIFALNLKQI